MYANSLSYQSFMKFINWEQKGNFKHRLIRIMLRTELSDIDLNETKRNATLFIRYRYIYVG